MRHYKLLLFVLYYLLAYTPFLTAQKPINSIKIRREKDSLRAKTVPQEHKKESPIKIGAMPRIIYGNLAFSWIEPLDTLQPQRTGEFMIFDFKVNKYGKVSNIVISECNDTELRRSILYLLHQSVWQPAKDSNKQAVNYDFKNMIARKRKN